MFHPSVMCRGVMYNSFQNQQIYSHFHILSSNKYKLILFMRIALERHVIGSQQLEANECYFEI